MFFNNNCDILLHLLPCFQALINIAIHQIHKRIKNLYLYVYRITYSFNSTKLLVFPKLINCFRLKWGCFIISSSAVLASIPNQMSKEYTVSIQGVLIAVNPNIWPKNKNDHLRESFCVPQLKELIKTLTLSRIPFHVSLAWNSMRPDLIRAQASLEVNWGKKELSNKSDITIYMNKFQRK